MRELTPEEIAERIKANRKKQPRTRHRQNERQKNVEHNELIRDTLESRINLDELEN